MYHLYVPAANPRPLFADGDDYADFFTHYTKYLDPVTTLCAWCLLPNHWHLMVRVHGVGEESAENPLSATFRLEQLAARYAVPVLRIPVRTPRDYPHLVRHIHQNPTLHGHSDNFRTWRWSSYATLLSGQPTRLARETVHEWFFGVERFEDLHWERQDESRIGYLIRED
jgi:hypothetical protein